MRTQEFNRIMLNLFVAVLSDSDTPDYKKVETLDFLAAQVRAEEKREAQPVATAEPQKEIEKRHNENACLDCNICEECVKNA